MEATVAERGQITLPKAVRDALGLTKGTKLKVELIDGRIVLRKDVDDALSRLRGRFKLDGFASTDEAMRAIRAASCAAASEASSRFTRHAYSVSSIRASTWPLLTVSPSRTASWRSSPATRALTTAELKALSELRRNAITSGGSIFLKGSAMLFWGKDAACLPY